MSTVEPGATPDWRTEGVRVVPGDALDPNTPQTPGMHRAAAVTQARTGSHKLWAGTVTIHPGARTGAHHHGELESVIYVIRGRARMRWGVNLEFTAEAGAGSFIFVPPFVPHQEINALDDQPLECVVIRSGQEPVVVNLDIAGIAEPETVPWVDPAHPTVG
ncbi:cupin domain-containing protein [Streptacidiphilus rugosus]|uniref:cupin domain-containing protein n=1 Tax=Streptacidiphilus rugosus TaxID=405783 RepID=UPI00056A6A1D|nr:cupin domain-containing protein [Streptacidiphilus rugosus]